MDDSSPLHVGVIGVVLQSPKGDLIEYVICLQFSTTNNEAKYEALIKGLDLAKASGIESLVVQGDS